MSEQPTSAREALHYLFITAGLCSLFAVMVHLFKMSPPIHFITKHDRPPITDTLPMIKIPASDNYYLETDSFIYIIHNDGKIQQKIQK